jgi:hypothetical protein
MTLRRRSDLIEPFRVHTLEANMICKDVLSVATLAIAALLSFEVSASGVPVARLDPVVIAAAKTKAEHEAIADAYDAEAVAAENKVKLHAEMSRSYRDFGTKPPWNAMSSHCRQLQEQYRSVAKLNRQLAGEHRGIAARLP